TVPLPQAPFRPRTGLTSGGRTCLSEVSADHKSAANSPPNTQAANCRKPNGSSWLLAYHAIPCVLDSFCLALIGPLGPKSSPCQVGRHRLSYFPRPIPTGSSSPRLLRSDDTEACKEAPRCFGRSHRSAQGSREFIVLECRTDEWRTRRQPFSGGLK